MRKLLILTLAVCFLGCWFIPPPVLLTEQGWHLSLVFILALVTMMSKLMPMPIIALSCLLILAMSNTISLFSIFEGYGHPIVWLIFFSFYITRGIINTQFSNRIAYLLISKVGNTQIGLGMGMVFLELIFAPFIPSSTARAGGVMFPIVSSLTQAMPNQGSFTLGKFLVQLIFHSTNITSAMFVSAMAANPLIVALAEERGVIISWKTWAIAASIPGLLSLIILVLSLCFFFPGKSELTNIKAIAKEKLLQMGKMKSSEKKMISIFILMITGWSIGALYSLPPFIVALGGILLMLKAKILSKKDIQKERTALDLMTWFPLLLVLGIQLNRAGVVHSFVISLMKYISFLSPEMIFISLIVIYVYGHYLFTGNSSQVLAIYVPCLSLSLSIGISPYVAALSFACASSLNGGLTHYATGHAPLLYSSGYFNLMQWWKWGFLITSIILLTWIAVCPLWWTYLQLY